MAKPTDRDTFKQYCLRKLGSPVISINVADEQVEDRIDEAIAYWYDYHFDGTEKVYFKHAVTQQNVDDGFIEVPHNIIGVVRIFDVGGMHTNQSDIFSVQFQLAISDLYSLTSQSMTPYYMTRQHIELIQQILIGQQPIRYNRHTNRLYVDMNWKKIRIGHFIVAEAYQVLDQNTAIDMWSDRWLLKYASQLIKRQWGSNLSKFTGMSLPGGTAFNGDKIYDDAEKEIMILEQEMISSFSIPNTMMIG